MAAVRLGVILLALGPLDAVALVAAGRTVAPWRPAALPLGPLALALHALLALVAVLALLAVLALGERNA